MIKMSAREDGHRTSNFLPYYMMGALCHFVMVTKCQFLTLLLNCCRMYLLDVGYLFPQGLLGRISSFKTVR